MENKWEALLERIEQGMTTSDDADKIRDLLDEVIELKEHLDWCVMAIDGSAM